MEGRAVFIVQFWVLLALLLFLWSLLMAKKPKTSSTEEIKEKLQTKKVIAGPDYCSGLSTGSTLLNLAYTGRPDVGYIPGNYFYFVGDSNSGKTILTLVAMAEATRNPMYVDYRFILDNVEDGIQMDLERFFGRDMVSRLEPPRVISGAPAHSETVEEFYFNLDDALDKGPCIYVLDSMDALSSQSESKHFDKLKKASRKTKDDDGEEKVSGSFGDGKAKINSSFIRQMLPRIAKTNSILIIISQTRDNVGTFSFEKNTRSGGRSLDFYAQVQTWSSIKEKLRKKINDANRHIGNICQFHVKRSRFTGRENKVSVPIYFSHGVDDIGSCVDFLITEKRWSKEKGSVIADELDFRGTEERLIAHIEENNLESRLQGIVADTWYDIEEKMAVNRKKKYT